MTRKAVVLLVLLCALGFLAGFLGGVIGTGIGKDDTSHGKTVTVEKTVPGPERMVEHTVYKKKPGSTIWIVVCGNKETTVKGAKPNTECKLPATGGG